MIHLLRIKTINTYTGASEGQNTIQRHAAFPFGKLCSCVLSIVLETQSQATSESPTQFVPGKRQSRIFSICRQSLGLRLMGRCCSVQLGVGWSIFPKSYPFTAIMATTAT